MRANEYLLRRAKDRDKRLEDIALESERAGDVDNCRLAMMVRAENRRLLEALREEEISGF